MVGKGNIVEKLKIILVIEGPPAAVGILHADEPRKSAANPARMRSGSVSSTRLSAIKTNAVSSTSG